MKVVRNPLPEHVIREYGGSRAFRRRKRDQLRRVLKELADLRYGCAYFPCGQRPLEKATAALKEVEMSISPAGWGK